jgi:hypothetical protein
MSAVAVPVALERALLMLVDQGGGAASWHWLATRLPLHEVPLVPDAMTALKALRARGLVGDRPAPSGAKGMDAWSITGTGRARLAELARLLAVPGPLEPGQLAALLDAMRGPIDGAIRAFAPLADDGPRMAGALRQVLAVDAGTAERVAFGASIVDVPARAAFARELAMDPRASVRLALFETWAPPQVAVAGTGHRALADDAAWDGLLALGLADADKAVRAAAAKLAFATDRGATLTAALAAITADGDEGAHWALLALGAARDAGSLARLHELVDGMDRLLAAAAVRALAARPDGHERWLLALADLRVDVHQAAAFALANVATNVADERLRVIERDGRSLVQHALAAYRARARM